LEYCSTHLTLTISFYILSFSLFLSVSLLFLYSICHVLCHNRHKDYLYQLVLVLFLISSCSGISLFLLNLYYSIMIAKINNLLCSFLCLGLLCLVVRVRVDYCHCFWFLLVDCCLVWIVLVICSLVLPNVIGFHCLCFIRSSVLYWCIAFGCFHWFCLLLHRSSSSVCFGSIHCYLLNMFLDWSNHLNHQNHLSN